MKPLKQVAGFSLLEVTVAAALFALVAYFVNFNRGDGRRVVQKQNQMIKMQTLMDYLITHVSVGYHNFPTFDKHSYYACYNKGLLAIENHEGIADFALVESGKVREFISCMTKGEKDQECTTKNKVDLKHCEHARYIAYIIPQRNHDYIRLNVVSVHTSSGKGLSRLTAKVLRNYGY